MSHKIKFLALFSFLIFTILVLFSIFFKIQTFDKATFVNFNSIQILQVQKKTKKYHLNQKILLKYNNNTSFVYINSVENDNNFFYLTISKYFENIEEIKNVYIYGKKIILGEYIIKSIF